MKSSTRIEGRRSLWNALLAGALGGLAGSFAMSQFHSLLQNFEILPVQAGEDSTVKVASAISGGIFHSELTPEQKKISGPVVHYAFGASMAGAYGVMVEMAQWTGAGWGLPFGASVWLGAHVVMVPALGLSEPITRSSPVAEAAEFAAHLVYGAVAEGIRRFLRIYVLR